MAIGTDLQLDLSTVEQTTDNIFGVYGETGTGALAVVNDPADAERRVTEFRVTSNTSGDEQYFEITLNTAQRIVNVEGELRYGAPAATDDVEFAALYDAGGTKQLTFRNTNTATTVLVDNAGTTAATNDVPIDTWWYFRLVYVGETTPGSSADGLLRLYLGNASGSTVALSATATNVGGVGADLNNIKKIRLRAGILTATAGDKVVFYRNVRIKAGTAETGTALIKEKIGLQLGRIRENPTTAGTYDIVLHYRFPKELIRNTVPADLAAQAQDNLVNVGSSTTRAVDAFGDATIQITLTAQAAGAHSYTLNITGTGLPASYTTKAITPTFPTASGSSKIAFVGCITDSYGSTLDGICTNILAHSPHIIVFLGDNGYPDQTQNIGAIDADAATDYRMKVRLFQLYNTGIRSLLESAAIFMLPSDHDYGGDNVQATGIVAEYTAAMTTYCDRAISGTSLAAGKGWSVTMPQCHMIGTDGRVGRVNSTNYYGTSQHNDLLAKHAAATKPFLLRFDPEPNAKGLGLTSAGTSPDGSHRAAAFITQADAQINATPSGTRVTRCVADQHWWAHVRDMFGTRAVDEHGIVTQFNQRALSTYANNGGSTILAIANSADQGSLVSSFGLVTVDSSVMTVAIYNGSTAALLNTASYSAAASGGASSFITYQVASPGKKRSKVFSR